MSINFKAKSFGTMFHDVTQAERDKVYDIRPPGARVRQVQGQPEHRRHRRPRGGGATAVLEASIGAGRSSTVTRTLLLGVGSMKIKGDIYVVIKVNDVPVEELTIRAKHEKDVHAWALAFNKASAAVSASQPTAAADLLNQLTQLHDDGLLTDDEYAAERTEVIARI
jgi:hypothetical protein